MPKVPTYDSFQAAPNTLQPVQLTMPAMPDVAGQQAQQMGRAMQHAGDAASRIALDMAQQANQLRGIDAISKMKERAFDLQHGQGGYANLHGEDALRGVDGKPLEQNYADQLDKEAQQVEATLSNDAQRADFQRSYASLRASFYGQALQHRAQQQRVWGNSSLKGYIANSIQEGVGNPTAIEPGGIIEKNLVGINGAVRQLYRDNGLSQEEADGAVLQNQSKMLLGIVEQNLQQGSFDMASSVLQKFKSGMDPDSYTKGLSALRQQKDSAISLATESATSARFSSTITPTDWNRVEWAVAQQESGGKDFNPDGTVVTSPKGAKGAMQVMDATAKNPGFGVKPAQDDSLGERNRVGRELLPALLRHYGDLPKALAAYNAGAGAVDKASKQAQSSGDPGAWLSYLPKETQNYVPAVLGRIDKGSGPTPASKRDYADFAKQQALSAGASPKGVEQAVHAAEKRYELDVAARKDADERALTNAYDALIENGGNFSALPQSIRKAIPSGKWDDVMVFAKRIGDDAKADSPEVYLLLSNPDTLAQLSDSDFLRLRPELKDASWRSFADKRGKLRGGSDTEISAWAQQKSQFAESLGLKGERAGQFMIAVDRALDDAKATKGRPLDWGERQKVLDQSVLTVSASRWWGNSSMPMYQARIEGRDRDAAPKWTDDQLRKATQALVGAGYSNPTSAQVEALLRQSYGFALPTAKAPAPAPAEPAAAPAAEPAAAPAGASKKVASPPSDSSTDFARGVAFTFSPEGQRQRQEEFKARRVAEAEQKKREAEKDAEAERERGRARMANVSGLHSAMQARLENNKKEK